MCEYVQTCLVHMFLCYVTPMSLCGSNLTHLCCSNVDFSHLTRLSAAETSRSMFVYTIVC